MYALGEVHDAAAAASSLQVKVEPLIDDVKAKVAEVLDVVAAGWLVTVTVGAGAAAARPGNAATVAMATTAGRASDARRRALPRLGPLLPRVPLTWFRLAPDDRLLRQPLARCSTPCAVICPSPAWCAPRDGDGVPVRPDPAVALSFDYTGRCG